MSIYTQVNFPNVRLPRRDCEGAVLMEDWRIEIKTPNQNCVVVVPGGTETDGASIPRFLWRVCGHPLQFPRVYAALVHDWIYGGGRGCPEGLDRSDADAIYRDLLIRFGFGKVRAWTEYYALRLFGASHWCYMIKEN